jgi:NADH-quinone oxidoreductase subunit L
MAGGILLEWTWLIPLLTATGFVGSLFLGKRLPGEGGYWALAFGGAAGLVAVVAGVSVWLDPLHQALVLNEVEWFSVGDLSVHLGVYMDNLTALLLFVVGTLTSLILLYSVGYMETDREENWIDVHDRDSRPRFFAEMCLFITGMYGFVLMSNLLGAFVFWEIMGLCSYLLIGYWYHKDSAAHASTKAFLTTRVGDLFLFAGILILFVAFGSLDYEVLFANAESVAAANPTLVTVAMSCVFVGAVGKSAQVPLHVWLPDAMEGPTPVSALIHAATMVKAGVFLVARLFPLFAQVPAVLVGVAVVGAVTAFLAATLALFNNDIKRVLAYSTISQLGYMFLGLGVGALVPLGYGMGLFHLVNHAFFKALLFLAAGSVGHAVHTYDMREMGGLHSDMPITSWTMLIASLSIAGIVPFAGFWSKDELLAAVREGSTHLAGHPAWWGPLFVALYVVGLVTALLTAFYMFRLWFMTFVGDLRHEDAHPHESPTTMTTPLVVLAFFATVGGAFLFGVAGLDALPHFLGETIAEEIHAPSLGKILVNPFTYLSLGAALVGIGAAWYRFRPDRVADSIVPDDRERGIRKLLNARYHWSEAYLWFCHTVVYGLAQVIRWFDDLVVDASVDAVGDANMGLGQRLRYWTTGRVGDYALTVVAGLVALVLLVIYLPQLVSYLPLAGLLGGI